MNTVTAPLDRMRLTLWIGVAGAVLAMLAGVFGFHDASVWRLPGVLQAGVETALIGAHLPALEVEMQGQKAVLHGVASESSARAIAQRAALNAAGPGGPWAGGVTDVNTRGIAIGPLEQPFTWQAHRDPSRVTLTGPVPSDRTRKALRAAAASAFPNANVVDNMHIAGGAGSPLWAETARDAISALATLNSGSVQLNDNQILILGQGSPAAVNALRQHYRVLPAPFRARIEVESAGAAP